MCFEFLLNAHAGAWLCFYDACRGFHLVGLLPAAVVEGGCLPSLHLAGCFVALAVVEVVALYGAVGRDLPVFVGDDVEGVAVSLDDELCLESRQAVGRAVFVEAQHVAVAQY